MNRCHIQGTSRLRADGYMVFSANSQDRPLGEGKRAWAINSCPSLPAAQGGGAHLFVADLGAYKSKSGYAWADKSSPPDESGGTPVDNRIVKSVLLSTDENVQPPDVGSLTELYHPGGIDGVGDFIYVGFDGEEHTSYLKILDMADPTRPVLVGGRGFVDHKTQALGATAMADGRILLAVVDTNKKNWKMHFYIEARNPGTKEIDRHRFIKAGNWEESEEIGKSSQKGFPFLKYQSLALLRECGSDDIYLVGVHNDRRLRCGGLFELPGISTPTRLDLYKLHLPDVMGPNAEFVLEQILRRNMNDHNGEGCAGATAHVTPQGQIVAYAIEHGGSRQIDAGDYPAGLKRWAGKIRFYEYSTRVVMASLVDGDNVSQAADLCPDEAEDVDGFEDGDGCPDEDNDADGITDVQDLCPNNAEDSDGINDGDGCAEADGKGFFGNRIVISQHKIFSSTDDFAISDAGLFLTTGLVNWWRENGEGDVCVQALLTTSWILRPGYTITTSSSNELPAMKGNNFCPIWKSLEQRLAGRITPRQLQQDLGKVFNITIGRPLSLRERNGTIHAGGGVSPRADILRNALSTKWMDLRSKKSLTEYYESGALQAQRLRPFLHADDSVLEYGVGVGRLATHLRPYCRQLTGCDINPLMIQYGTLLCPEVRFYLLDQIPATPQFDFCYSVAVFFHMDPAGHEAALRYVQERLKPGGSFWSI